MKPLSHFWRGRARQQAGYWIVIEQCDPARAVFLQNRFRKRARKWDGRWQFRAVDGRVMVRYLGPASRRRAA